MIFIFKTLFRGIKTHLWTPKFSFLSKILIFVYFFYEFKNSIFFLILFFFFEFKILSFCQKEPYHHKIHRHNTLGSKLKICRKNCHKNQHLLIFDDFDKLFDYYFFFLVLSCFIDQYFLSFEYENWKKINKQLLSNAYYCFRFEYFLDGQYEYQKLIH